MSLPDCDPGTAPAVTVVVLNYNGWRDTIACVESVLRSDYPNFRVVICDNGSADGSQQRIRDWAAGRQPAPRPADASLRRLSGTIAVTPLSLLELHRAQADQARPPAARPPVVLIHNGDNLGFAGGNNVGLRYALAQPDCDYVWLLNNDTLVAPDALSAMLERLRECPEAGICGATLVDYETPGRIQALGGARYNHWMGTVAPIGAGAATDRHPSVAEVEAQMDYVAGACMLVTRAWLENVGLLSEDYFLYFEEIDWAVRAAGRYRQVYAPRGVVYHKNGATIGGPAGSLAMDALALRNRLRFTRRHRLWALPTVWLGLIGVILLRLRRGQWRRIPAIVAVMLGRWRWQP